MSGNACKCGVWQLDDGAITLNELETSHYKSWKLTGLYVFCAILFTGGFITRVLGAFDYGDLIKYIVSLCLTYAAP